MSLEDDLSLHSVNLIRLEEQLKAANRSAGISWIRLEKIYSQFKIPTQDIRKPDTAIAGLYKRLQKDENTYQTLQLIMLSVLLSTASQRTKAKVIFSHFDSNESQTLSVEELKEILTLVTELACDVLPAYVLARARETNSSDIPIILKYQKRLKEQKKQTIQLLAQEMTTEQLNEEEFTAALERTKLKFICSARSLRQFAAAPESYVSSVDIK